jgi:hypothetical protein
LACRSCSRWEGSRWDSFSATCTAPRSATTTSTWQRCERRRGDQCQRPVQRQATRTGVHCRTVTQRSVKITFHRCRLDGMRASNNIYRRCDGILVSTTCHRCRMDGTLVSTSPFLATDGTPMLSPAGSQKRFLKIQCDSKRRFLKIRRVSSKRHPVRGFMRHRPQYADMAKWLGTRFPP